MTLKDYFHNARGTGILSTADAAGRVDAAIYAIPHVNEDGSVLFLMRERLSYANVLANPHAAFLFIEETAGFRGLRLFLHCAGEEDDPIRTAQLTRSWLSAEEDREKGPKHLVRFRVEKILPLVGTGDPQVVLR